MQPSWRPLELDSTHLAANQIAEHRETMMEY